MRQHSLLDRRAFKAAAALLAAAFTASLGGASVARAADDSKPTRPHREFNIVPIAGGDTDIGVGVGEVGDWARLEPGADPYDWRLETGAFISFKYRDEIIVPYQDYYLVLSLPELGAAKRWRLDVTPVFTDETTLKYYGIGNATPAPLSSSALQTSEYGRMHPSLMVEARARLVPRWFARFGGIYTQNWLSVRPGTTLADQQANGSPEVRDWLGTSGDHGVALVQVGVEYDSRDNEIVTRHGAYHALRARFSPRVGDALPYRYAQINGTTRFYATPIPRWLTVSARAVGDVLLGSPPFYELARYYDEQPGIGGGKAVRGVPAQRYYGKVKLFGNLEVRSELLPFEMFKKKYMLGVALFADAGRVWTELGHAHPELDGTGFGLKYGLGGGLRLQQGQTFVVRADVAWSPDAQPIAGYFAAGQIF